MAPNWMMLERFVFRRDTAESFPGVDVTPFTASDSFLGRPFTIALHAAEPPGISRLYLHWLGGRDPKKGDSCVLVAAHRNLLLFRLIADPPVTADPAFLLSQHDHFICRASLSESRPLQLRKIPMCTTLVVLYVKGGKQITTARWFGDLSRVGIMCRGEDELAMAQLGLRRPSQWDKMQAELCVLRSKVDNSDHTWKLERHLPIKYQEHESSDLWNWRTDTVAAFDNHLCWVNYSVGGVLLCKVFDENPLITYLRLPIRDRFFDHRPFLETNRCVCVTKTTVGGHDYEQLKFIDIIRKDGKRNGPLSHDTGFSVSCHSLRITGSNGMEWDMTFFVMSDELWARNPLLPRQALMFPLVSMDKPNVVHFLLTENQQSIIDNMLLVTVDMSSKLVISVDSYICEEDISGPHIDLVRRRFSLLQSFLPSEIPKCLNLTRTTQ